MGGRGEWRVAWVTMPVDTADQAVYTAGQTDGHSSPDHTKRHADEVEQPATTAHPANASQWPHRVCIGPAWPDRVSKKPSVKVDLLSIAILSLSGQCLSVAIIISNKIDFNFCACMDGFPKSSHK